MDQISYLEKSLERAEKGYEDLAKAVTALASEVNDLKTSIKLDEQKGKNYDNHIKEHDKVMDRALHTEPCKTTIYKHLKDSLDKREIKDKIHFINIERSSIKKVALVSGFLITATGVIIAVLIKKWL